MSIGVQQAVVDSVEGVVFERCARSLTGADYIRCGPSLSEGESRRSVPGSQQ